MCDSNNSAMEVENEVTVFCEEENSELQSDHNAADSILEDSNEPAPIELTSGSNQDETLRGQEMAQITKTAKIQKGTELDKFKRRLIRALARLILKEKTPTEEVWQELKKQTGCDCKLLWNRMRALTIKKLRRLFTAEDVVGNITQIAQLTVTDWLLFDLVLVHEKIDVIGQDITQENKESPQILEDLFCTVVLFNIEKLEGDKLTKAWFDATKYYNTKYFSIRQCSPMLLQRRWYQLKEAVRDKFYQFWFSYRGTQRQLAVANDFKPTTLEMEIIKEFRYIATESFPSWESLIQQKKVALPEDFERLQLAKINIFRSENEPDLEVIEPEVETIDLELETDSEESRDSTSLRETSEEGNVKENAVTRDDSKTDINVRLIKTETIDENSDEDDIHVLESVPSEHVTEINIKEAESGVKDNDRKRDDIKDFSVIENDDSSVHCRQLTIVAPSENVHLTSNGQNIDTEEAQVNNNTDDIVESHDENTEMAITDSTCTIPSTSNNFEIVLPKITSVMSASMLNEEAAIDDIGNCEINGILKNIAENISTNQLLTVPLPNTRKILPASNSVEDPDIMVKEIKDEEIKRRSKSKEIAEKKLESVDAVTNDYIFEGIELEDDGIEYIEEEDHTKAVKITEDEMKKSDDNGNVPTIDLKLLLTPVVYTKKLDDMDVFRFIDYDVVQDKRVIENADVESKPFDRNSVKMEEICQERQPTPHSDAFNDSASEYNSEVECGPETINCSSWLLKKPRNLSYNPIKLCKNPDFNTRLKRLSAGFYTSVRNRLLLKECKPLTIDLHKAFEAKLLNNTLYLNGTEFIENRKMGLDINIDESVIPTELPIQNLINRVVNDIFGPTTSSPISSVKPSAVHPVSIDSHPSERNKVINLPDIAEVRRLNERLLTAEVTPIQISNINKPPVNIVSTQQNTMKNIQESTNTGISNETANPPVLPISADNKHSITFNEVSTTIINKSASATSIPISLRSEITTDCVKSDNASNVILSSNDSYIKAPRKISLNSLNKMITVAKAKFENRVNNQQQKSLKEPKKYWRPHVEVSWNPTRKKLIIPEDRLLASDTIDKILSVCRGDGFPKHKKWLQRMNKKRSLQGQNDKKSIKETKQTEVSEVSNDNDVSFVSEQIPFKNESKNTQISKGIQKRKMIIKRRRRPKIEKTTNNKQIPFCCWARERIVSFETKNVCSPHRCPRPLCNCCCRQDLLRAMFKSTERRKISQAADMLNEIEETTNTLTQKSAKINISPVVSNCTQRASKVSIGVNTDYDHEFENTFATNFAKMTSGSNNINKENELITSSVETYALDNNSVFRQTQTTVNIMDCVKSSKNYITMTNIEKKISINTIANRFSTITPKKSISQSPVKTNDIQLNSNVSLQESRQKLDKVLFLTNDKMKHTYLRNPICLGKNKILLCSFEKPNLLSVSTNKVNLSTDDVNLSTNDVKLSTNDVNLNTNDVNLNPNNEGNPLTQPQLALPDGVRIVLLPNKELALSIDPGVELDSGQLAYLPAVMASVQQQLVADTVDIATPNTDESKIEGSLLDHNNTLSKCKESEITIEDGKTVNENPSNVTLITDMDSCTKEQLTHQTDDDMEVPTNKDKEVFKCAVGESNSNVTDLKDGPPVNKKTILSDLMEMSGISTEDTHITSNESTLKQQSECQMPMGARLQTLFPNEPNEKLFNDPLFINPVVKAALSRCPELCIIFSYQELKCASENNAQFFKMDIETGVIVPISLLIKKQSQANTSTLSKAVIDLTDEPEEGQEPIIVTNTEERNVKSLLKGALNKGDIRPVKLFSAVHPSILRRGKSLLMTSLTSGSSKPNKKSIRVFQLKRKRKQALPCAESIDLDSDNESNEANQTLNAKPEKFKFDSDSDTDDEPLAVKAKRIKELVQTTAEEYDKLEKHDDKNNDTVMVNETAVDKNSTLNVSEDVSDEVYINSTPRLEPVVFEPLSYGENIPESSDEDCILGV